MSLEKENHGRRRFQDPDENFGNMQNFWRVISRVKHPFPSHSRVTVSLAQTRSYLSPAFSALPTSPPLWLSRDLNALNRHFPSILLLTNSRVLWGSTWRQCSSVAPSAQRTGCRQPGHSHGVRTMQVACLWGISQCSSSSPACCPFSSTNRILSYTYFLSFIGIPSPWWVLMKWRKSLCLNMSAGESLAQGLGPWHGISPPRWTSPKWLAHGTHLSVALNLGKAKRPGVII